MLFTLQQQIEWEIISDNTVNTYCRTNKYQYEHLEYHVTLHKVGFLIALSRALDKIYPTKSKYEKISQGKPTLFR